MADPLPRFRVLLVVRDPADRTALMQFLTPDFELTAASTAAEAIAALKRTPFEVLLTEQTLDGALGSDVAAEAVNLQSALSSVVLADRRKT